ncbi:AraC family transcriptional regulator [Nocardioides litoris]|uniref:AraC family transcriptional regulator n=1 Tax=Nocardioides litoris TaxID=1926648 RepID=UPI0011239052|nr:AraC family transcriptional regulator [Nocardioides litoris]
MKEPTRSVPLFGPLDPGPMRPAVKVAPFDSSHTRVGVGAHAHHDLEILYFAEGTGSHRISGHDLEIEPGTLFLVPPRLAHDLGGMGDARGWVVEFSPSAMASIPEIAGSLPLWRANPMLSAFLVSEQDPPLGRLAVPAHRRSMLESLLTDMQRELETRDDGYRIASAAQVVLLLVNVARLAADVTSQYRRNNQPLLAACFEAIEKGFRNPLSTTDVARSMNVSATHLSTLVKERTGRTVLEWITERRMSEARQLLLTTDLPVEMVARSTGFPDPTYFSRRFRQVHGTSPRAWRSQAAG